jgi:hypothetical protein
MATSHDYGATWTQQRIIVSKRPFYAYAATVLPDGTIVFAESSVLYSGHLSQGGAPSGSVWHHAIISQDNGDSWNNLIVDKVAVGEPCVAVGCGPDFYIGQSSVATDDNGKLVFAYEGAATDLGAPAGLHQDLEQRWVPMGQQDRALGGRRERDAAPRRGYGQRRHADRLHADERRGQPGRVEPVVPLLCGWRQVMG